MEKTKDGAGTDCQLQREYNGEHIQICFSMRAKDGSTLSEVLQEFAQLSHRFYLDAAEAFKRGYLRREGRDRT